MRLVNSKISKAYNDNYSFESSFVLNTMFYLHIQNELLNNNGSYLKIQCIWMNSDTCM